MIAKFVVWLYTASANRELATAKKVQDLILRPMHTKDTVHGAVRHVFYDKI